MKLNNLTVTTREAKGKGGAREARRQGNVPAILYGENQGAVPLTLDRKSFEHVIHGKGGSHALIDLAVEDQPELGGPVMVKAVQVHPVNDAVLSADLLRIHLDRPIHTYIPIHITGQCKGVIEGGVPDQHEHEIEIEALPLDVPEFIEADITEIHMNETFTVEMLPEIKGVTIITPGDRPVIGINPPRVVTSLLPTEEEEAEAAGEESEEGGEEGGGKDAEEARRR